MDEEKNDVKDTGEILPAESSTTNQTTEDAQEPKAEVATDAQGTEAETAESNKGANQRIRELNQRTKTAEAKAQSLAEKLAEITGSVDSQGYTPTYTPQVSPGQEISQEQYQGDVTKTANALVELKIKQNNAVNRIQNESIAVVGKYKQLDPESDEFNKELSDTITEATEALVRQNPYSASPIKIVDRMMKPYLGAVTKEVGKVTENIVKQVSETALRPTSIRKQEKTAAEKTIKELEQELGVVY